MHQKICWLQKITATKINPKILCMSIPALYYEQFLVPKAAILIFLCIVTQFFAIFDNFLTGIYKFLRSSKSYVVGKFKIISGFFSQILWKSGSDILVTFPSHLKHYVL